MTPQLSQTSVDQDPFLSLDDVRQGTICIVRALHSQGAVRQRLMDMGVVPKSQVTVVRSAPLRDPIEIQIGEAFVAIRRTEARAVEVDYV